MKFTKFIVYIAVLLIFSNCNKSEFLDKKPNTAIIVPKTLKDFQALLDNTNVLSFTGGLAQIASDDYVVPTYTAYQTISVTERNSYIWAKNLYNGEVIYDWSVPYKGVFYCNSVLNGLEKSDSSNTVLGKYLKGWALFDRAYAFYDLTRNFCKAYDAISAKGDFGIPLRLLPGIDYTKQRATLQQSFDQILGDLNLAESFLPSSRPSSNLNRPSKIAVYALLARIYLDMRNYRQAESNANKCLALYNTLIDYNQVSKTATTPFSATNDELIFNCSQVIAYTLSTSFNPPIARIAPDLIKLYSLNDLRLQLYFNKQADGSYTKKRGYRGGSSGYPFTGLATDEVYLIKAECLARRNEIDSSMNVLNQILINRWDPDATIPSKEYEKVTSANSSEALSKILQERRKELVWRGLRWHDLKRLNKEGANIELTRTLNDVNYVLPANDSRYIFPIPDDEITLSGIQQNVR